MIRRALIFVLLIHQSKRKKTRPSSVCLVLRVNPFCCVALQQCYPVEVQDQFDYTVSSCFITVGRAVADRHPSGQTCSYSWDCRKNGRSFVLALSILFPKIMLWALPGLNQLHKKGTWFHCYMDWLNWLINLLKIFESWVHMCLTPLHCGGRMNRLGLPGFDIHCPCLFLVPLQPQDKSLQFSYTSLQGQVPCWHGGQKLTWTCQVLCFTLLLALCFSCSTGSCTQLPWRAGKHRLRLQPCAVVPPLSHVLGNQIVERAAILWPYQALCSPLHVTGRLSAHRNGEGEVPVS